MSVLVQKETGIEEIWQGKARPFTFLSGPPSMHFYESEKPKVLSRSQRSGSIRCGFAGKWLACRRETLASVTIAWISPELGRPNER
ncbi:hypothetical protein TWF569_000401 [Orbilia oligospora]|uniref:Uncharacterized protein n=1 Tax=Orbilia oligospora TaxID=2813651 RepID=A0A7C8TRX1_ORBOL|nr:hypothetical protein TWF706_003331 [Orbilia oligospora]KAF3127843.1 hypothetical protein TWF594_000582 [Orbilia oligospora]KAF3154432.1 hypothetical protein TWF569_000401 [Orbilia oligospora]KAF3178396.1 hypothetical protein TWF751_001425 [Orbilia oligospora]KAF3193429.1 hypothetical protein TWF225_010180 [Orbilia oligospora]